MTNNAIARQIHQLERAQAEASESTDTALDGFRSVIAQELARLRAAARSGGSG